MLQSLKKRKVSMTWIGLPPQKTKEVVLLIPQFNEGSRGDLEGRLNYFKKLSEEFNDVIDVIVIDDGSTDGSLNKIKVFKEKNPDAFFVSSVTPNSNKVGALYLTSLAIAHEYVILSDFDTDIQGLEQLFKKIKILKNDSTLMGCYFRMLPFEGEGNVFLFQQLEYSMARSYYKFHEKSRSVPVMPGAGCCYKREVLKEIYSIHSGLRNGEDREATLLGLKLGYKTFYSENILTLTRPPSSFGSLIKQRIRWNLGYIETFNKEKEYYYSQIKKLNVMGIRTLLDLLSVNLVMLFPFIVLVTVIINWKLLIVYLMGVYFGCITWSVQTVLMARKESEEFKDIRLYSILSYPMFKIPLDCIAWIGAFLSYIRRK